MTAFFKLCETDTFARGLFYSKVPKYYTWNKSQKVFKRRKQGTPVEGHPNIFSTDALGRLYTVHPKQDECFYLRLLLINVRGPTSFDNLKIVDGLMCATFREACQRLHLLEDDTHWDATLAESSIIAPPHQIRTLFSIIIATCSPSNPLELWRNYADFMSDDILNRMRRITSNPYYSMTPEIHNEALIMIEDICLAIASKGLSQLGMVSPNRPMNDMFNRDLQREHNFDLNELSAFVQSNLPKLNAQQRKIYDTLMQAVTDNSGGFFF